MDTHYRNTAGWLEDMEKQRGGRPYSDKKKTSINLYLSHEEKVKLQAAANAEHISLSSYIRQKLMKLVNNI
ncbi:MAG: ribbon-helix-helix domain-containing protein [Campylobacterota bacterium]|nr:ribbon-helix-helix domain-containing protein [Campylobacterota bacterium]